MKPGSLYRITTGLDYYGFKDYSSSLYNNLKLVRLAQGSILLVLENFGSKDDDKVLFLDVISNRKVFYFRTQLALEFYQEIL